ncbi:MarR family winged helix-turn-helix transcriptional regulator [Acidisoma silvae]|uniref:MarR family transcriptional regulator n=1 Tax=Acidisoma silvae TaxID=2802396 RepID=A0A963YX28_9PROT|nr:MarR family transcriptional regulator [Acidisoma silvae]MCB8877895.1 MarR family transcriptional regulator [Acidisoma silvae]
MSSSRFDRYVVLAQRFGTRTLLFQQAAARQLDLTATELGCFRLVQLDGPIIASDLAKETGLTPASLSVIIDKLVARNFLSREQDKKDRRRWLLRAIEIAIVRVDVVYTAHAHRVEALLDEYTSEEFETALRFIDKLSTELKATAIDLGCGD